MGRNYSMKSFVSMMTDLHKSNDMSLSRQQQISDQINQASASISSSNYYNQEWQLLFKDDDEHVPGNITNIYGTMTYNELLMKMERTEGALFSIEIIFIDADQDSSSGFNAE